MSSIKAKAEPKQRAMLNTTINAEIMENFKNYCKEIGMPMNMILEVFMAQFANNEFVLKMGKRNRLNIDVAEDEDK